MRIVLIAALLFGALVVETAAQEPGQRWWGPPVRTPDRNVHVFTWNWKALRERHVVMQQYDYSCGAAAMATLIRYYWGDPATEEGVLVGILSTLTPEEVEDRETNGLSLTDLRDIAVAAGYQATMGRRTLQQMTELKVPVIVRLIDGEYKHFVVFRGVLNDRVFLADPAQGNVRMPIQEFVWRWPDGVILVVAKPDADLPDDAPLALRPHSPVVPELQPVRRWAMEPKVPDPLRAGSPRW